MAGIVTAGAVIGAAVGPCRYCGAELEVASVNTRSPGGRRRVFLTYASPGGVTECRTEAGAITLHEPIRAPGRGG